MLFFKLLQLYNIRISPSVTIFRHPQPYRHSVLLLYLSYIVLYNCYCVSTVVSKSFYILYASEHYIYYLIIKKGRTAFM